MKALAGPWLGPRFRRATIDFFHSLKSCDDKTYLVSFLKYYTAPTRLGIKIGCLVNLKCPKRDLGSCWEEEKDYIEGVLGLKSLVLKREEASLLVLLYQPRGLRARLEKKKVKDYLSSIGYKEGQGLEAHLQELRTRFNKVGPCPNEVGIFLGYPLKDVLAFGKNSKNCKFVGYWKCYSQVFLSKCKFFLYDLAKWSACRRLSHT